ncbi:MAG: sulfurtransferase [Pseudonocardia sp.]|nr:sulfurtransferase [Pseudonocardia sp.]
MEGVSPLIRPAAVSQLFTESADRAVEQQPVPLDVRWRLTGPSALSDYRAGHLPGAVFVDLDTALADPPGHAGRHPLPEPDRLIDTLAGLGVGPRSAVIAYDDADGSVAARAWWLLRWLGFPPDQVKVLDGGYAAWVAAGYPVTTDEPNRPPARLVGLWPGAMPVLDAHGAADVAHSGVLLDARAPARYRGETEPIDPRAGHIPGARNAPSGDHLGPDGYWRSAGELAARFERLGVSADVPVGAYCGSGVTACSVVLAMEYAGVRTPERPAALYAGSWSNWCADPARPVAVVAVGARPGAGSAR